MTRRTSLLFSCFAALYWIAAVAPAAEPAAKTGGEPAASAPPTHTVKKSPLRITVDLDAAFEAQKVHEIALRPEEWSGLTVLSAAPHGARVRQGDVLLSFETEKLDRTIADLRTDLKLSEIASQQDDERLKSLEKSTPLDMEAVQRAARNAAEDEKRFLEVDRAFNIKSAEFNLKAAKEMLEYQEEELHQLEKMYKADDITEETEQIVLKRARDAVDRARFMVERTQLDRDHALKYTVPRTEEQVKDLARRRSLDLEKNKVDLPMALQKLRLDMERSRVQRSRSEDRLKKLLADREMMTVKSPADGIVYYGKATRGKFGDSTMTAESLRPHGTVQANQVVMTLVEPRPMVLRAAVPEDQLHRLRPGLKGTATPTGYPDSKLAVTVDRVSDIPTAPGSFDARLNVELDKKSKFLMPGMACKVKLVPYLKKDALTVPPKAVTTDELDEQKHYVYLLDKDGKPQKRDVTLGEKTDKQVEIRSGLAEGDKVLLEAPK